ncbi:MAG: hypothetical protein JRJ26_01695 [Deltaproteobacteria bacterium]|nr:hypothetical protein [Deltaproteobacteria bacterium]
MGPFRPGEGIDTFWGDLVDRPAQTRSYRSAVYSADGDLRNEPAAATLLVGGRPCRVGFS